MVQMIRRRTGVHRVGHAGTLDPFAEGLLIVLVGRESTKRQKEFLDMDKTYDAQIRLGATSTTDDCTGTITSYSTAKPVLPLKIQETVRGFLGDYDQMPPAFSAKKINGKKAYELARKGIAPALQSKRVTIRSLEILDYHWPLLTIRCTVSSGTYIRALARDIGEKLGCGAYVEKLTRTSIGPYSITDAKSF